MWATKTPDADSVTHLKKTGSRRSSKSQIDCSKPARPLLRVSDITQGFRFLEQLKYSEYYSTSQSQTGEGKITFAAFFSRQLLVLMLWQRKMSFSFQRKHEQVQNIFKKPRDVSALQTNINQNSLVCCLFESFCFVLFWRKLSCVASCVSTSCLCGFPTSLSSGWVLSFVVIQLLFAGSLSRLPLCSRSVTLTQVS